MRIRQDRRGISSVIVVMLSLVILVTIVANVVLWSYQMNQLDWEKMQEDINIVDVRDTWSYNPSGYGLGGSTSLVFGSVSNLKSDDSVYMTFRSYYSGTNTLDFVDSNTSDVDSSPDKGTHSNFTAQQYCSDNIFDTLTEANIGTVVDNPVQNMNFTSDTSNWNFVIVSGIDFAGGWDDTGQSGGSAYIDVTTRNEFGEAYWNQSFAFTYNSSLQSVYLNFRYNVEIYNVVDSGTAKVIIVHPNGTAFEAWNQTLTGNTMWPSLMDVDVTNYFNANGTYSLRLDLVADLGNDAATELEIYYDDAGIAATYSTINYELDLEEQWTTVDYDEQNEYLCIRTGTMGAEDLKVDIWNGSAWITLAITLAGDSWNNFSVSSYLESSTFTIRFKDGMETGDITQDSWDIDVTLLHVWSDEYTLEVEFTGSSNMEDWSRLTWTVGSAWTVGSVNVTLQLYNYALGDYPTSGNGYIAYTSDDTPNTDETKNQTITVNPTHFRNATGYWKMKVKGVKAIDTQFDFKADWIEFKVVVEGTLFTFKNTGSLTSRLVSLWVINSTHHQRYDIDVIINSGETLPYSRVDISLPAGEWMVKVVTERGNIAIFQNRCSD